MLIFRGVEVSLLFFGVGWLCGLVCFCETSRRKTLYQKAVYSFHSRANWVVS